MSRLGIYAAKIEEIRNQRGLDSKGFRLDGTDPEAATKEAMEREMYRRADERLPEGLGSGTSANADDAESLPSNED
jgi:hypothetical protein